jgi:L-iditol 2-dehydrogenase
MKALVLEQYKVLKLIDMPIPAFGPGDLLVKVKACGICGSDVHGYDGSTGRRLPPIVMGHEAAGVVEAVGDDVKDIQPGDRVTFDSTVYCGNCFFCSRGQLNLCDNRQVLGVSTPEFKRHGAFAEYVSVPRRISYKLPDSLSFEHAALIEAVSIAVHGVNRTPIRLGDTCVIVGAGMIGSLTIQAAKLGGCAQVIAIDVEDRKLDMARSFGASHTFNPKNEDVIAKVKEVTEGRGADSAIDCVGATAPIQTCMNVVRKGGHVTLIGNVTPKIELPLQIAVARELTLYGSCASNGEYPECIALMASGKINVDPIISARIKLEDGPKYFERLYGHDQELMKVIFTP